MQEIPKDIIEQAQQGSIDAFEMIYNVSSGFAYNLAFRVSGNKHDAEEITQDIFMKIHKNIKRFEFRSSFKTWIYRIAVNTAINFSKGRAKKGKDDLEFDDAIHSTERKNEIRIAQEAEHNEAAVDLVLNILNSDQRVCMILRNIEGLSYEEIANALKININTVRTRLKRAREKLIKTFQRKEVIEDAV